ncbi:hypothetical protein ACFYYR_29000 [Streptomyces sp. NPDC001922]|uniref:hypothetical protein n=1 Tax=Streptomyces sp. NPDC001922 TaxID=3364624 RepID=UPI0036AE6B68
MAQRVDRMHGPLRHLKKGIHVFTVSRLLAGATTASLAAAGLFLGGVATATPAQADALDCYTYINGHVTSPGELPHAKWACRLGTSIVTHSKCVDELDKIDGVHLRQARNGCNLALRD